jgi:hypothetical protein
MSAHVALMKRVRIQRVELAQRKQLAVVLLWAATANLQTRTHIQIKAASQKQSSTQYFNGDPRKRVLLKTQAVAVAFSYFRERVEKRYKTAREREKTTAYEIFERVKRVVREPAAFLAEEQPQRTFLVVLQDLVVATEN